MVNSRGQSVLEENGFDTPGMIKSAMMTISKMHDLKTQKTRLEALVKDLGINTFFNLNINMI